MKTNKTNKFKKGIGKGIKEWGGIIILFSAIIGGSFLLSGCEKDFKDVKPTQQLITQSFNMTTILTDDLKKGFDPNTFVVEYVTTPTILTLTDGENTYTTTTTIQDLINGSVVMEMLPGVYDITFNPNKGQYLDLYISDKMVVDINMMDVNIQGTPITLQGNLKDGLIVVDIPNVREVRLNNEGLGQFYSSSNKLFNNDVDNFKFGYTHNYYNYKIIFMDYTEKEFNIPAWSIGKLFWVVSPIGGTIEMDIPGLVVEKIVI